MTPGFPRDEKDDRCIPSLQLFVKKLSEESGIKVTIVSVHYPSKSNMYRWHSCDVFSLGINNRKRLSSYSRQWRTLRKIHKENKIDCIHSFWLGECAFVGRHFAKKNNLKHLCTLMGQDARKGNIFARLLPLKKMTLISLSNYHQTIFQNNYGISTMVIPWGVSSDVLRSAKEKTIDVIGIGSLIPLKRYSEFIETIALLKVKLPAINVVLIGDGVQKELLLKKIEKHGLTETIQLEGALPYAMTQSLLSRSKVLLHSSEYESFGMVFAEAQVHQVPIVSREVGMAAASSSWIIGNSVEAFSEGCHRLLISSSPNHTSFPNIESTVEQYCQVYFKSE